MTSNGWIQIATYLVLLLVVTKPLGIFLHRVMEGRGHFLQRPLGWLERGIYRVGGVDGAEQR